MRAAAWVLSAVAGGVLTGFGVLLLAIRRPSARNASLLVCFAITATCPTAALAQTVILTADKKIIVWKDAASLEAAGEAIHQEAQKLEKAGGGDPAAAAARLAPEIASGVACVVAFGTSATVERVPRSWLWEATVKDGPHAGCRGLVRPTDFKTAREVKDLADTKDAERREAVERAARAKEAARLAAVPLPPLSSVQRGAIARALRPLKDLQSVTRVGVVYRDYMTRLGDARIAFDRDIGSVEEGIPKTLLNWTMDCFANAGAIWGDKLQDRYSTSGYDAMLQERWACATQKIAELEDHLAKRRTAP